MSPINFENCNICGKYELRKESRLVYNQSQNIFYYVWDCYSCGQVIYEEANPEDIENVESKKALCLFLQEWNDKTSIYNKKFRKK